MNRKAPFILLDDARANGANAAHFYAGPREVFVALRPEEVTPVLAAADAARVESGGHLAGYIAYEAGLALEDRLAPLALSRTGANGALVWLGLFEEPEIIPADKAEGWLASYAEGDASIGPLDPQITPGEYVEAFATLQEAIRAGDFYQANLTFPLAGPAKGDPMALYAAIRPDAAAGYGGLLFDGQHWLLSFSPELFLSLKGDAARVKPMKGTRPRGASEQEDAELASELAQSVKDRAENLMIVDLMRNDLSRVAVPGSVTVDSPFAVETYPTVHQMTSTVTARLAEGKGAMDLIRALFPCGSITGTPKIRAMELIGEVEPDARGPYCGAIGRIGPNGDAAFNVAIRTIRLTPGENDRHKAVLGVGGAIVADSSAMTEWRECIVKGGFTRGRAGGHDLLESMRFDPVGGISLLEAHLERMKASASALGFSFDRHEARNRIQALCFELDTPAKLRLLCSRSGALALEAQPLRETALPEPVRCVPLPLPLVSSDWRLRHKTTDRGFYDVARAAAQEMGAEEAIFVRDDGLVTEACHSCVFVERDGLLLTPPLALGLLPGVLRGSLIEEGKAEEAELKLDDLADGFLLGNAVRGLSKAGLA